MFFFFKQKTAYEMRISDWSSDVCSSDLRFFQQRLGYINPERPEGRVPVDAKANRQAGFGRIAEIEFPERRNRVGNQRGMATRAGLSRGCYHSTRSIAALELPGAVQNRANSCGSRSEERRVGIECVRTCRSRWAPYN